MKKIYCLYYSSSEIKGGNLDSSCNQGCHCSEEMYNPVCGIDGLVYYNPCYAGCLTETVGDQKVLCLFCFTLFALQFQH